MKNKRSSNNNSKNTNNDRKLKHLPSMKNDVAKKLTMN